jgi:hypothetical protein
MQLCSLAHVGIANNAENVQLVSHMDSAAYAVAVAGNDAYLAHRARLKVVDVSNPASPTELGACDVPGVIWDVGVTKEHAYVADGHDGLRVIDVSDPAHPTEVSSCHTPGSAQDVAVTERYAYIAAAGAGLIVIDISNPAHPTVTGVDDTHSLGAVAVAGKYAYAVRYAGMTVIDISDPARPVTVGSKTLGYTTDVAAAGEYAYLTDGRYPRLIVVDVSDPTEPREAGSLVVPGLEAQGPRAVAAAGGYAHLACYDGLRVVDISDPAHPTEAGFYDTPSYPTKVAVAKGYTFLADGDDGLFILQYIRSTCHLPLVFN